MYIIVRLILVLGDIFKIWFENINRVDYLWLYFNDFVFEICYY